MTHDERADQPEPDNIPAVPVIDSQQSAARALAALFMANADAGNDAANDELIELLARRRRAND